MTLNAKIPWIFSALMGVVLLVMLVVYTLREFSLYTAKRHARRERFSVMNVFTFAASLA